MGNNQGSTRFITNKELSFKNLLYSYKQEHELISVFNFSLSLVIAFFIVLIFDGFDILNLSHQVTNNILYASSAVFGVIIASFGLFAAITDKDFLKLIHKLGQLKNILFPFWFCSFLWSILLTYCIVTSVFGENFNNHLFLKYHLFWVLFVFCICMGYTLSLIGDILKLTIYKANFIDINVSSIDAYKLNSSTKTDSSYFNYLKFIGLVGFIIISYDLLWFHKLKDFQIITLLTGAINLFYIYLYFKLMKKLIEKQQKQSLILAKQYLKLLLFFAILIIIYHV